MPAGPTAGDTPAAPSIAQAPAPRAQLPGRQPWPYAHIQVGIHDPLPRSAAPCQGGGAAALRARGPYALRYIYLTGGANTGNGWQTWQGGSLIPDELADSQSYGFGTVFSYYQLLQSQPASRLG